MGVCVTLNEGYLRAADRGSKNLYRFLIKIYNKSASNEKTIFLVRLFYCFLRLPIYKSIASIFWQSASYVYYFSSLSWKKNILFKLKKILWLNRN